MHLTTTEVDFIQKHLHEDPGRLLLQANKYVGLDIRKLAGQIQSRQKAAKKLPEWTANPALLFPPALSVEQASSEATARYKANLISGHALIDMTGGMGVDCYYMSQSFRKASYFEQQPEVADAAHYNFEQLGATQIQVISGNSLEYLAEQKPQADWIFADPARRNDRKEKVVLLSDYTPDITAHLDMLFEISPNILIKTSPLLDIDQAARELRNLREVHAVGYESECKELLFVLDKNHRNEAFTIVASVIDREGNALSKLTFDRENERDISVGYKAPAHFLYEPHAAVLKAGAFKILTSRYPVHKLAPNTHLYTSDELVPDFPGRRFRIVATCKPDIKEIMKYTKTPQANLTTRNFPAKTEDLRKKWKLKEGGSNYLFATTLSDQSKIVVVCEKP